MGSYGEPMKGLGIQGFFRKSPNLLGKLCESSVLVVLASGQQFICNWVGYATVAFMLADGRVSHPNTNWLLESKQKFMYIWVGYATVAFMLADGRVSHPNANRLRESEQQFI